MKNFALSLFLLLLAACGNGKDNSTLGRSCSGSVIGQWGRTSSGSMAVDRITFGSDCSGYASACETRFTFQDVDSSTGIQEIEVTASITHPNCLTVGHHTCAYSVSGNALTFNCGTGSQTFFR